MQAVFAAWPHSHRRRLSLRFASSAGGDGQVVGVVTSPGASGVTPVKCSVSSTVWIGRRLGTGLPDYFGLYMIMLSPAGNQLGNSPPASWIHVSRYPALTE